MSCVNRVLHPQAHEHARRGTSACPWRQTHLKLRGFNQKRSRLQTKPGDFSRILHAQDRRAREKSYFEYIGMLGEIRCLCLESPLNQPLPALLPKHIRSNRCPCDGEEPWCSLRLLRLSADAWVDRVTITKLLENPGL